jgi:hypothetical protein
MQMFKEKTREKLRKKITQFYKVETYLKIDTFVGTKSVVLGIILFWYNTTLAAQKVCPK